MPPLSRNRRLSFLRKKLTELQTQQLTFNQYAQQVIHYKTTKVTGSGLGHVVQQIRVAHPVDKTIKKMPLDKIIISLNDRYSWTREQIADWIDTLDDQPTFYPSIPIEPTAHKVGSTGYRREMPFGPDSTIIAYPCQCLVIENSMYCGPCKSIGGSNAFKSHACYDCPDDGKVITDKPEIFTFLTADTEPWD